MNALSPTSSLALATRQSAAARLIRLPSLVQRLGCSRSTVYQMVADGLLPKQVKISRRCVAWPADEIEAVMTARLAGTDDAKVKALVINLHGRRGSMFCA